METNQKTRSTPAYSAGKNIGGADNLIQIYAWKLLMEL